MMGAVAHRASERGGAPGSATPAASVTAPPAPVPRTRTSFAESFAGADPQAGGRRRVALLRIKLLALSFLVGAPGLFLACRWAQAHGVTDVWVGYVGAASEAGMGGALGDWVAVTGLFKHPPGPPT